MKAYKMTVLVIDHSGYGPDEAKANIENEEYTNPTVMSIEEADIGEWDDNHPLNNAKKQAAEFKRLFPEHQTGHGNCPDCKWHLQPEGCNTERDSKQCLLNKGPHEST